jgi:CBS-domain-containing membrane protein
MMDRRDAHLDGMLRHLGAAYYESLHGRASAHDVARALGSVEEHMGESPMQQPAAAGASARHAAKNGHKSAGERGRARWHRRVRDVMTTSVVTVDRTTPYKEIARLMAEHKLSALPVLMMGRRVAGVVSEADLLRIEDKRQRTAHAGRSGRSGHRLHLRSPGRQHWGLTAGELMTAPAVTIYPEATISAATRVMNQHHVKLLPVTDGNGVLAGIVTRRELLSVFLRPDEEIADDIRGVLGDILFADTDSVNVVVKGGIVTLTGDPGQLDQRDLIPVAVRLTWDIDGVVDVVNNLRASVSHPEH